MHYGIMYTCLRQRKAEMEGTRFQAAEVNLTYALAARQAAEED